jgi:hypothetical protein
MVQTGIAIAIILTLTMVVVLLAVYLPRHERLGNVGIYETRCEETGMTARQYEVMISDALDAGDWEEVMNLYGEHDSCFTEEISEPLKTRIRPKIDQCKGTMCSNLKEEVQ